MNGAVLERVAEAFRKERIPLEVLFEVTHRCNLPCAHCYLPSHQDRGELSFDEICDLLDQLREAGTLFLTLTGGEVLARRDFNEIVEAAAARGFAVKVLTNATQVTDEVADRWAAAGVLEVSVSVYGAGAEVHDRVTGMPGSYERTMRGIERLRARGVHVVMKAPLLAGNGERAVDVHALARRQSIPCTFDLVITPKTNGDPGPLELALHHRPMVELMTRPELAEQLVPGTGDGPGPEPCNAGRGYCAIGPTGDLFPCVQMPLKIGNLRQRRFAELWRDDPQLEALRRLTASDLQTCRGCDVAGSCSRCPGQAMLRGQGLTGCDLSAKPVAKARAEARLRLRVVK